MVKCPSSTEVDASPGGDGADSSDLFAATRGCYTVFCRITGIEKANGAQCYVLRAIPVGSYPPDRESGISHEVYGYYRVDNMALSYVKVMERKKGATSATLLHEARASIKVPVVMGDDQVSSILFALQLPPFPATTGENKEIWRSSAEVSSGNQHGKTPSGRQPAERVVVTTQAISATDSGTDGKNAVSVAFYRKSVIQGKTTESSRKYMEQVWVPGKPWWTSMRNADGLEFVLLDKPPAPMTRTIAPSNAHSTDPRTMW